jgi:hypothetical protein
VNHPVLKSWDEVWQRAQKEECTHFNYAHGKIRFKGILEEPEEIGQEIYVEGVDRIRIRFYKLIDEEYVEVEDLDCWLKMKSSGLSIPDDFEAWDQDRQRQYLNIQLERASVGRFSRQMDSADKMWHRIVGHLMSENVRKDKVIQELNNKIADMSASKGIMNIYEFLTHPNADKVMASVGAVLNNIMRGDRDKKLSASEILRDAQLLTGKTGNEENAP